MFVLVVVRVIGMFALGFGSGDAEGVLPVILSGCWPLLHVRYEHGDFPDVLGAESLVPGGHAGVADAVANRIVVEPFRIIGRILNQLRWRRIERTGQGRRLLVERAVAARAVHRVDLHSIDQVFGRGQDGAVDASRMMIGGRIDCAHRQMSLQFGRGGVGIGWDESKQDNAQSAQNENGQSDHYSEYEIAHEASPFLAAIVSVQCASRSVSVSTNERRILSGVDYSLS